MLVLPVKTLLYQIVLWFKVMTYELREEFYCFFNNGTLGFEYFWAWNTFPSFYILIALWSHFTFITTLNVALLILLPSQDEAQTSVASSSVPILQLRLVWLYLVGEHVIECNGGRGQVEKFDLPR